MFLSLVVVRFFAGCDDAVITVDNAGDSGIGNPDDTSGGEDTGSTTSGALQVTPSTITIPPLFVGGHASDIISIANVGDGPILASLEVVGGWSTSYTLDSYTSAAQPGASTVHTLSLTPTAWGDHSVSVLVDDPDSGGHVEIPVTAWVQLDEDGDLHGSIESGGDDCDDADAGANPDATDVWYDGVDSDCAGNNDYDQDGDGHESGDFGGDDCDDTDATRYPGATDIWYDGADSDCAGNDDFDQDGDGYVSEDYQGRITDSVPGSGGLPVDDCNDTDATVHSGAADVWYDGVDSDCAGNNDYDQDADGHQSSDWGGDDCLDTDATAYPGAADAWYDGVDSDCAGNNDYDQDADGTEYPTDCNDTDPTVTGPTTETLNDNDDDCNGLVDDVSVSDVATGVLYGVAASAAMGDHGQLAMGADVTGDGKTDLLVGTPAGSSGYGTAWIVDGATSTTAAGLISDYDTATITGDSGYYPIGYVNGPMADVDGDGVADFGVGGGSSSYYTYGRSYLFLGGSGLSGSIAASDFDGRFSGDSSSYYGSSDYSRMIVLADLDGDGLADVSIGSGYDDYDRDTDAGSVAIFDADGLSMSELEIGDADDRVYGTNDYDYVGMQMVSADVDGDGNADLLVGAQGYDEGASGGGGVFVVLGTFPISYDTRIDDASTVEIRGDSGSLGLGEDTLAHPGDVDGDGALDVGLTSEDDGSAWLFMGIGSSSGSTNVSDADYTFIGTAGDLGSSLVLDSDLDGDGADEFVVGADGDDSAGSNAGLVYVFSDPSAWSSLVVGGDASATLYGSAAEAYFGAGAAGGADFDGDGKEDLAIGEPRNDHAASDAGAVWIVKGW